jgi:hypothetical protein
MLIKRKDEHISAFDYIHKYCITYLLGKFVKILYKQAV